MPILIIDILLFSMIIHTISDVYGMLYLYIIINISVLLIFSIKTKDVIFNHMKLYNYDFQVTCIPKLPRKRSKGKEEYKLIL